jgi:phage shock protein A
MLTAMAGAAFSYTPGETIPPIDDEIADVWVAAGIAEEATDAAAAVQGMAAAEARVVELEAELAEVVADRDALKGQAEELGVQVAALEAKLAAAAKAPEAPKAGKARG